MWEERKHPRDESGQFTSGSGSSGGGKTETKVETKTKEIKSSVSEDDFDAKNFVDTIDEIDYDKVERNEAKNKGKDKSPSRKDKYGNPLVSDEAFKVGQRGAKAYLDYMTQFNSLDKLKHSNIFLGGLETAVTKALEEGGYDSNYDVTYQDTNEIIGSVVGENVDIEDYHRNATKGWSNQKYTGYDPSKGETSKKDEQSAESTEDEEYEKARKLLNF